MKRALITGGTGFVGGYLLKELEKSGYEVALTSRNASEPESETGLGNERGLRSGNGPGNGRYPEIEGDLGEKSSSGMEGGPGNEDNLKKEGNSRMESGLRAENNPGMENRPGIENDSGNSGSSVSKGDPENNLCDGNKSRKSCLVMNPVDKESIVQVLKKFNPDIIFHLAAQSSVAESWKNPGETFQANVMGTVNLLEAVREVGISPGILLIGSSEEYGKVTPEECPIKEDRRPHPGNIYAATKFCQSEIGRLYAEAYGMDIVMTRSFNHTGPGQTDRFVASDFCRQVAEINLGLREPVMHVGNLSAERDFTDVRDIVKCYVQLAENGRPGETYNVGSGVPRSIRSILDLILVHAERKVTVKTDPARFRPVDVPVHYADVSKVMEVTGWKAEIGMEMTVEEMVEWWMEKLKAEI